MVEVEKMRKVRGDHPYDLSDSFNESRTRRVTQTAYYRAGNFLIAIAELNRPNHWDDDAFEAAREHLQQSWNSTRQQENG